MKSFASPFRQKRRGSKRSLLLGGSIGGAKYPIHANCMGQGGMRRTGNMELCPAMEDSNKLFSDVAGAAAASEGGQGKKKNR